MPAVAPPDSEAKFLSAFGTDNLLFLIRSDDGNRFQICCSCGLYDDDQRRVLSFLFFLYRLSDRVPQLRTSGAKVAIRMGEGKREGGRRKKIKKRKREKETWREISNFFQLKLSIYLCAEPLRGIIYCLSSGRKKLNIPEESSEIYHELIIDLLSNTIVDMKLTHRKSKTSRNPLQKSPSR